MTSWMDVLKTSYGPKDKKSTLILSLKGFCMGVADLIPGVSGGTVAFVTGIYQDLLMAVSSFNGKFFRYLITFRIKEALQLVPLRFIVILFTGIFTAIFTLAHLMDYLLSNHPILMRSVFFGLIGASIVVMGGQFHYLKKESLLGVLAGLGISWVVVGLIPMETPDTWWFIWLCGAIGITAMILPGISGSFLLLILGKYEYIIVSLKNPFSLKNITTICIFASGAIVGIICFSRILKYFLRRYNQLTMTFLIGVLIGSLRKIWPWKTIVETKIIHGKTKIIQEANIIPQFDRDFYLGLFLITVGFLGVVFLDQYAKKPCLPKEKNL